MASTCCRLSRLGWSQTSYSRAGGSPWSYLICCHNVIISWPVSVKHHKNGDFIKQYKWIYSTIAHSLCHKQLQSHPAPCSAEQDISRPCLLLWTSLELIKLQQPTLGLPSGVISHVLFHLTCKCLSYIKQDMFYFSSNHAVTCELGEQRKFSRKPLETPEENRGPRPVFWPRHRSLWSNQLQDMNCSGNTALIKWWRNNHFSPGPWFPVREVKDRALPLIHPTGRGTKLFYDRTISH